MSNPFTVQRHKGPSKLRPKSPQNRKSTSPSVLIVESLRSPLDRQAWRRMEQCGVCTTQLPHKKKHCLFCFLAVCAHCCVLPAYHPETHSVEDICKNCYSYYLSQQILTKQNEYSEKIKTELLAKEIAELKQKRDKKKADLQKQIDAVQKKIQAVSTKDQAGTIDKLEQENQKLKTKLEELESKSFNTSMNISQFSDLSATTHKLSVVEDDNLRLKAQLERLSKREKLGGTSESCGCNACALF